MAQLTITIPDEHLKAVLDAFADQFNYDQIKEVNETKAQFAKRMVIDNMKKIVSNQLAIKAAELARIAAKTEVDSMLS